MTEPSVVDEPVLEDDTATINDIAGIQGRSLEPASEDKENSDFEDFLKRLNANFANGDNASDNTDTTTK